MWRRHQFSLKPRSRGFHLVTREVLDALPDLVEIDTGLLHLQLMHTSASLTLNENADSDVRHDMALFADKLAPANLAGMRHTLEGPDDMPAHVLASLFGTELTIAVERGELLTGTWQGIWLGEHRERGGTRRVTATLLGE
ncbi:secondary thiamine-phosphate synthase enzyme YjbQ [Salinicola avicenniae]|uniref:secondary thiamine-phosphate synthase enzyme YjbQ n=1 Tax=Salinicola avicenniae TaxID=2916836 RepID=UPI002072CA0B|nr:MULTISPECIES: secondary thiamine-phosphate synthase enzyme YjbQ [unclassified Salinicola]